MCLLIGHADQIGELLLGQAKHDTALSNTGTDVTVDALRRGACLHDGAPLAVLAEMALCLRMRYRHASACGCEQETAPFIQRCDENAKMREPERAEREKNR